MLWHTHPMGEADEPKKTAVAQVSEDAMVADTMGGRVHVRWDETAQATPQGQIVFFAETLWDRLHQEDPSTTRENGVSRV